MDKAKRVFWWFVSNTTFCILLWYGTIGEVQGAWNIVVFTIWFKFVISWAALSKELQEWARKKGPPTPAWIDGTLDAVITCFLVWQGHWVLGTAHLLHTILLHSMYAKTEAATP
jgi:hypothetical protein